MRGVCVCRVSGAAGYLYIKIPTFMVMTIFVFLEVGASLVLIGQKHHCLSLTPAAVHNFVGKAEVRWAAARPLCADQPPRASPRHSRC